MLVLSRKIGEEILIPGYGVALQVVAIQGSRVRIGIAAPSNVRVFRKELLKPPEGAGLLPGQTEEGGEHELVRENDAPDGGFTAPQNLEDRCGVALDPE